MTEVNTTEYLAQLLKDKKQLAAFPNVFIHLERLLDEGNHPQNIFDLSFVLSSPLRFFSHFPSLCLFRLLFLPKPSLFFGDSNCSDNISIHAACFFCLYLFSFSWSSPADLKMINHAIVQCRTSSLSITVKKRKTSRERIAH